MGDSEGDVRMNLKLWKAKREQKKIEKLDNSIDKFKYYISECKRWKKNHKKRLKQYLKELSKDEFILFGTQTGYIEKK